jgi:hypothetical protein
MNHLESAFPSARHLSSSGSYPLGLSGSGDPPGSNCAAGLALRVTGTYKLLHHGKVEITLDRSSHLSLLIWFHPLGMKKGKLLLNTVLRFTVASDEI